MKEPVGDEEEEEEPGGRFPARDCPPGRPAVLCVCILHTRAGVFFFSVKGGSATFDPWKGAADVIEVS